MIILCNFERIGGITGKRIHIRRLNKFYLENGIQIKFWFNSVIDVLNTYDFKIDLERFLQISMRMINFTHKENGNLFDLRAVDLIGIIEFKEGVVLKMGMTRISDLIKLFPVNSLEKKSISVLDLCDKLDFKLKDQDLFVELNLKGEVA